MNIKLLSMTEEPLKVMYVAARTCYSDKSTEEILKEYTEEKAKKLLSNVLGSGHTSIAEYVNFTFSIEGVSRSCSHQVVRHRHATFSQKSQRYVEITEDKKYLQDVLDRGEVSEIMGVANKYFVVSESLEARMVIKALISYRALIEAGFKKEDARNVLPNATKTSFIMGCNLRELIHICNLRCCTRAQKEIRTVFQTIASLVKAKNDFIGRLLVPKCVATGYCNEHNSCGLMPKLKREGEEQNVI